MNKIFCLVRFARKSGKIDTSLESEECDKLFSWAVKNTTKTKDSIIFEKDAGKVIWYCEGTGDVPKIYNIDLGYIDDYCEGLLEAVQDD